MSLLPGELAMERYTVELQSAKERFVVEQALAYHRELEDITKAAADGQVIEVVETATLRLGRQWMASSFEQIVNSHVENLEKKRKSGRARTVKRRVATKDAASDK